MTTTLLEQAVEEKSRGGQGVATGNSRLIRRWGMQGAAALAGKRGWAEAMAASQSDKASRI
jgi:hypothetical protein